MLALLLLLPVGAGADPALIGRGLNQHLVGEVMRAALTFAAPRALEPVTIPELTLWALEGLSEVDTRLRPEISGGSLRLLAGGQVLLARASPAATDTAGWGEAAAQVVRAGWDASESMRAIGTQGVVTTLLDAMCDHLDPYSRYVPPAQAEADRDRRGGVAEIGVRVARAPGGYVIAEVDPDGPAAEAGVRPGVRLLALDGEPADGLDEAGIHEALAGPEGTDVVLTVRERSGYTHDIEVTRVAMPPRTVTSEWRGDLLWLHISGFADDTGERLGQAVLDGASGPKPPRGMVFDLRGNHGGVLREAVTSAESVLTQGVVATTTGRDPEAVRRFLAHGVDLSAGLPVVVLVDGETASAAEILAAALADQHRAVVAGSVTLGKGLIQTIATLPDGGELLVSWSRVLAPLGWPIQGLGVLPQVCTSLGAPALAQQLDHLAQGQQPMAAALVAARDARAPLSASEAARLRAVCPAATPEDRAQGDRAKGDRAKQDLDAWAAQRLLHDHTAYATALLGPPPQQGLGAPAQPTAAAGRP